MPGCLSCSESEGHSYYCILFTGQESRSRLAELGPLLESGVGRTAFSYGGSTGEGPASKLAQAVGRIHLLAYGTEGPGFFLAVSGRLPQLQEATGASRNFWQSLDMCTLSTWLVTSFVA